MAHAASTAPKIPEKRNAIFHNTNKTYFKTDLEKIATSLNKDNFFSNKRILAISFADSHFT